MLYLVLLLQAADVSELSLKGECFCCWTRE